MRLLRRAVLLGVVGSRGVLRSMCAQVGDWQSAKTIYEFSAKDIDGNEVSLEKYRGYVCIIVNVASK
ncbi:phospholipid hydroperoxide glutathione peroxidase, mitochondrial-like [Lates japonicus]|uniref:Phospholipid hydroperoxide glutathione peroxidase, mitochondrial-like protein n=1 Tax=Lates japonicus TaxID=270547 RepID=A0AAD3N7H6_LATJO|nr:phospholipid hydroperoxide glutathione peroxidase, mitochondrial-like protein [Lates japonicus]GLD69261.1 phospholipid hydroperoxide glutathione peroxidase, mitochondrial-like protein [Lates japonicus]